MILWLSSSTNRVISAKALDCPDNIIPIFQPPHLLNSIRLSDFGSFSKLQWENCQTLAQLRQKLADVLIAITPEQIASLTSTTSSLKPYLAQLHKELV